MNLNLNENVTVTCNGKTSTMKRKDAIEKYHNLWDNSEGSEQERYARIYFQLLDGNTVCDDRLAETVAGIPVM